MSNYFFPKFDSMANWGQSIPSNALTGGFDMSIPGQGVSGFATPGLNWGDAMPKQPGSIWDSFLPSKDMYGMTSGGWGSAGLGIAQGLGSAYMGMKQYGLAKSALEESKKQFNLNYDAQRKTTNAALEDRQAARVASNPGAYQSVGDYMKKNGI